MLKRNNDAFIEKMASVHNFKSFYQSGNCLLESSILESDNKEDKKYALVRVFVDFKTTESPYAIFIKNKERVVFIDLVAGDQKTIDSHLTFSPNQQLYKIGSVKKNESKVSLNEGDSLAAAILWSVKAETNVDPKIGLDEVKKLLSPKPLKK